MRISKIRATTFAVLACLGWAQEVFAAVPSTRATLTECFLAALERSEAMAIQSEWIIQAEERVKQSFGTVLPTVSGTASRLWQEPINAAVGANPNFNSIQDNVRFSATQPLFRGLREFAALQQSKRLLDAQGFARKQAESQLYQDVATSFYAVMSLDQELENLTGEIALYGKRVSELEERARIGRSRKTEVLSVEAAVAGLRAQADGLRGQIKVARETLSFLTGLPADLILRESEPELETRIPSGVENWVARVARRPDVAAAEQTLEAANEAHSIAFGAHLPSLDLNGNYYLARPGLLNNSRWDAKLLLTLPIFSGGAIQSRVREAASQMRQSEFTLGLTRRRAATEIRQAFATWESDSAQVKSLETAAKLSESDHESRVREYRFGQVTNLDVLQAMTAWRAAKRALDRARFVVRLDVVRLEAVASIRPQAAGPIKSDLP